MDEEEYIQLQTLLAKFIEMGFLSNPSEDRKMQKSNFQTKMAKGIADGIDAYFK